MYKQFRSLHLNGTLLDQSRLIAFCKQKISYIETPEWEIEIAAFLLEWMNEEMEITVKTSGSTGTPKSIKLLKDNVLNSARMSIDFLKLGKGTKALLCMPVRYIAGRMMIVRAMLGGWELHCTKPVLNPFKETNNDIRFNFTAMTPMQLSFVLADERSKKAFDNTDKIIIGGAPTPIDLVEKCRRMKVTVYETYGMTETISHIALKQINGKNRNDYFELLPGITIRTDKRNCLVINAPGLTETEVITNDIVEIIDPVHFRFIGRYDHIINTGGVKITPEITEGKIKKLTDRNLYISSLPDELLGNKVVLVMEGIPLDEKKEQEFLDKCLQVLDKYEMPKQIIYHYKLLKNESGKLIRKHGGSL